MKDKKIVKTFLLFLMYLIYPTIITFLVNQFAINSILCSFLFDAVFLLLIVFLYMDELKRCINKIKITKISTIIKKIVLWVFIIFASNMIMGIITESICPDLAVDDNTGAITSLFEISTYYTIFKTMIFAIIAEELLFRKSIIDIFDNKFLFVIISGLIYTLITFVFIGFPTSNIFIYFLMYFIPEIVLSIAYIKNDNNIIILMLIKFVYQLIPLTFLLLS
ncbi:MAG: hypothetical protein PUD59_04600 [bacterium]|nr:hypothetical protein [bacterium]